jgi:uncharacterized protein YecT (DUF1311 family)/sugar lactone lactonase YvrE
MKSMKSFLLVAFACCAACLYSISVRAGGLAFDGKGNLFVAGPEQHLIFKFTPDGTRSTFASGLRTPVCLALDGAGNLFVADTGSHSIFKFTPDRVKSTFASGLKPYEMAFDGGGNLFVSDLNSVYKLTPEGKKTTFATGISCFCMAFDRSGNLVCDNSQNSIFKFTPEGTESTFASGLSSPWGLAVDGAGNLFVAEQDSHSILKFSPDATKSTFASGLRPYDVAFDPSGNLFVRAGNPMFKFTPDGTKSIFAWMQVSPDNQWEYQCSDDGEHAGIVKAGTTETVLDLSEDLPGTDVLWAPDSKRFAVNSGSGRSRTTALYQLRGDKWVALRSPEDETSKRIERAESAQLRKMHVPKNASRKHFGDGDEVRKWADADTAILYAHSDMAMSETRISAHFLLTLKFDAEGNWKVVESHQVSDKEVEKEDAGEDVSGPAQTTEQEGLSADASFRDADRQLNKVYNALRARLSPSQRDGLKKEQLAWIDRRNAAAQVAKEHAQENSTDVADREVTKTTLARAAELEKRLKKAK